jgi:hypothetical protein
MGTAGDSLGYLRARLGMPGFEGRFPPPESQSLVGSAELRLRDLEALEPLTPQLERSRDRWRWRQGAKARWDRPSYWAKPI